jgi:hypothetical protein
MDFKEKYDAVRKELDSVRDDLIKAKADLTDKMDQLDDLKDDTGSWLRDNVALIGGVCFALIVGFAIGAALL